MKSSFVATNEHLKNHNCTTTFPLLNRINLKDATEFLADIKVAYSQKQSTYQPQKFTKSTLAVYKFPWCYTTSDISLVVAVS